MNLRKLTIHQWGRLFLGFGLGGMLLLYSVALIPAVQQCLSHMETGIFFSLNKLLGKNPVWDWTLLVMASDFWVYAAYSVSFLIFIIYGWRKRKGDYGQIFGYILFVALVVCITEEFGDIVADNLHRMLPWKEGVASQIKASYHADFFTMHRDAGVVDDSAVALFCLYFLMAVRSPRISLASLALLLGYSLSSVIVGTQWITVQCASALMGAFFAGLALLYSDGIRRYLEKKASKILIASLGAFLLNRRIHDPGKIEADHYFGQVVLERARQLNVLSRRWFWDTIVKRRAIALLNADPLSSKLYSSPDMTMARVKSGGRVRFLKVGEREVFVIRAIWYLGGIFRTSLKFIRFTDSVKNNVFLRRLGFPVPRVIWTQEGITSLGLRNYFFAIEEYLEVRPLDPRSRAEVELAMQTLARLHAHTSPQWGEVYEAATRSRTGYVLEYLRGNILYHLHRVEAHYKLAFSPQELGRIWNLFQAEAEDLFSQSDIPFRLIHGDVTPLNLCAGRDSQIRMIDFLTVHYDLAGWEIIQAAIALTRGYPAHRSHAWESYFQAAGEARWQEFRKESRLAFARFALRELAHRRVCLQSLHAEEALSKEHVMAWIEALFSSSREMGSETAGEARYASLFEDRESTFV